MNSENKNLDKFIEEYNSLFNTPNTKMTRKSCEQFRAENPNDFKNSDWSIDRHRKRLMDWVSRQRPKTLEDLEK